jgi:hypothetical protein
MEGDAIEGLTPRLVVYHALRRKERNYTLLETTISQCHDCTGYSGPDLKGCGLRFVWWYLLSICVEIRILRKILAEMGKLRQIEFFVNHFIYTGCERKSATVAKWRTVAKFATIRPQAAPGFKSSLPVRAKF